MITNLKLDDQKTILFMTRWNGWESFSSNRIQPIHYKGWKIKSTLESLTVKARLSKGVIYFGH